MTATQANVPVLRFRDENGRDYSEWETSMFSGIAQKVSDSYIPTLGAEKFECIELESLSSNTGLLHKTFKSNEQKSTKIKFMSGDVLFGKLRPYLKKFYLPDFDGVCTSEIWVLRPKSVCGAFLYYLIQSDRFHFVANIQSGTKMPRSDWNVVSQANFEIPEDLEEQQKIASFLSAVDTRIEQLCRKKELLEQYKKGLMQKLFSQELRFRDENGRDYPDWGSCQFLELFKVLSMRKFQIKSSEVLNEGRFKVIDQGKNFVAGYTNDERNLFKTEGVIVYGDHTTIVKFIDFDFVVGADGTKVLTKLDKQNIRFLYYCLDFNNIVAEGYKRHFSIVKKLVLSVPSIAEQHKIADFLSSVDKKIELVAQQIDQARLFKKGLLQQMFV